VGRGRALAYKYMEWGGGDVGGNTSPCSLMIVTHNTALEGLPKCATGGIELAPSTSGCC
jgi:hypothetical protein